jgi:hypothetical protein
MCVSAEPVFLESDGPDLHIVGSTKELREVEASRSHSDLMVGRISPREVMEAGIVDKPFFPLRFNLFLETF